MAITASAAELFADVCDRTGRGDDLGSAVFDDSTNNNGILQQTIGDITSRWPFVEAVETVTFADDDASKDMPANLRSVFGVSNSSNNNVLREIPSMQVYLKYLQTSSAKGTPTRFLPYNEDLYVYPTADGDYTLNVYCSKYAYALSSLEDCFYEAVAEGCCYRVLRAVDQGAELGKVHWEAYESEIQKLVRRYTRLRHPVEMIES